MDVADVAPADVAPADDDWPWWRGPSWNNCAVGDVPPLQFSPSKNVIWKFRVPGLGHATPCIFHQRIFLATADEEKETQSVVCCDRSTGRELWHTQAHRGGFMNKHKKKVTVHPETQGRTSTN